MKKILLTLMIMSSGLSHADIIAIKSFDTLWHELYQNSYQQKAVVAEKEGNELSYNRAKRHWLPRAYVGGQMVSTNDPTQVFFNNLGQRSVVQNDFIPTDLNNPGRKSFKTGTMGIDLPVFEGGLKSAQSSMYQSLVKSSEMEVKAKKSEEYADFSRQYGGVLIHTLNGKYLSELKLNLEKIISNYQVGSQSNPVGYSGLLGLKGVSNRLEGMLAEFEMKSSNSKKWIDKKIQNQETSDNWTPDLSQGLQDFLNANLSHTATSSYSSAILAQELKVKTLEDMRDMETARFLPKVGLFAQNNIYNGNRNTSDSQVYGVYLMWDLFNSDSFGRSGEAKAKAMAGKAKLEAYKQDEKIMFDQLNESKVTLEKSLVLLHNSDNLLKEQTENAMKLFRSGMLTALQLAEVINRRADLIENKNKVENQYLDVYSRIYQLNN